MLVPGDFQSQLAHFQEFCELVNALGLLEIGHDDNIYAMEIGECYKSGFSCFSFQCSGI